MTRQQRYQQRRRAEHRCVECGQPAVTASHCEVHRQAHNRRERERRQNQSRG